MLKVISWNIGGRNEACWRSLLTSDVDVALLQEAGKPPEDVSDSVVVDDEPWATAGAGAERQWRAAVVQLNWDLDVSWYRVARLCDTQVGGLPVSCPGTMAVADVRDPDTGEVVTLVSLYALWERPHPSVGSSWIYADAAAHRLVSDLCALIGQQRGHRIVAAGDLNILHGHGEHGSLYWGGRYRTVFDRLEAVGMRFVGPQFPNGRQAQPWPAELPEDSRNVPTYHTRQQGVEGATRQLDFVFASDGVAEQVKTRALNRVEEWGESDHCRVEILIGVP